MTGSLCHGVSRLDWLFPHQVHPRPLSLTMAPKSGLAITLTQGAGVRASVLQVDARIRAHPA